MTQLANANLLDDDLANGNSLRKKRLNRVAQRAENPIPKVVEEKLDDEDDYEEKNQYNNDEYTEPKSYSTKKSFETEQQRYFNENSKSDSNSKNDDGEKILGMKPILFYGLVAVGLAIGGYIVYNKFIKKGKANLKSLPDGNAVAGIENNIINK
jgi:hypothetical protein